MSNKPLEDFLDLIHAAHAIELGPDRGVSIVWSIGDVADYAKQLGIDIPEDANPIRYLQNLANV